MTGVEQIVQILSQIEGPYKFYVLIGIVVGITAVVTHFIFRTLKWFLLIIALGVILFYLWAQLYKEVDSTWWANDAEKQKQIEESADVLRTTTPTP